MKGFALSLKAVCLRYAKTLAKLGAGLLLAGAAGAAAYAVVWPLWYLATEERETYSYAIAGAAGFLLLAFLAGKLLRSIRFSRRDSRQERRRGSAKVLIGLGLALAGYASYLLWIKLSPLAALPVALAALLGAGLLRDATRRPR